jgi:tetratricopeptide (TPR) repeat protein
LGIAESRLRQVPNIWEIVSLFSKALLRADQPHGGKIAQVRSSVRNEAHAVSQPNSRITFHSSQSVRIAATALLFILVCTTGCSRDPHAQEMHFLQSGKRLVEKNDYPRALLEFKNAAHFAPHDAEPYYQIALAYLAAGDAQAAVNNLMHASRLDPKHVGVQLKLTELMTANQDRSVVEEGEKRAQSLFEQLPGNAEAANALGLAELRLGKTDSALAHFQRAMADSPGYLSSAINLAVAKMASGDARQAEDILKRASDQNPRDPRAKIALGRLYLSLNRVSEAESAFQQAVNLDGTSVPALTDLAAVQVQSRKLDAADRTYQRLSALPNPRLRVTHALFLQQQNRPEAAIAELQSLVARYPSDRDLRTTLVQAYIKTNRIPKAEAALSTALAQNPHDADALLQMGDLHIMAGKYTEAEKELREVLHQKPDSAAAHYALAQVFRSRHELTESQELSEAVRLDPNLVSARIELARFLLLHKGAQASLELLQQTPASEKDNFDVVIQRNAALFALDKRPELRASLDAGLARSRAPEFLMQDALLRIRLSDFAGARRSLLEALDKKPGDVTALKTLYLTYRLQHQTDAGVRVVQDRIANHTRSAPALVFLGQLLQSRGQKAEANAAFLQAKQSDASYLPADLELAQLETSEGRGEEARARLEKLLAAHPSDALLRVRLGMADEATAHWPEAIEQYRRAIDLEPGNVIALNNLAYVLAERSKDLDGALRYAEKASEAAPDNPTVSDTVGWIYFRKGLYARAVQNLTVASQSNLPLAKYHLALAYLRNGSSDQGKQLLNAVISKNPDLPGRDPLLEAQTVR